MWTIGGNCLLCIYSIYRYWLPRVGPMASCNLSPWYVYIYILDVYFPVVVQILRYLCSAAVHQNPVHCTLQFGRSNSTLLPHTGSERSFVQPCTLWTTSSVLSVACMWVQQYLLTLLYSSFIFLPSASTQCILLVFLQSLVFFVLLKCLVVFFSAPTPGKSYS